MRHCGLVALAAVSPLCFSEPAAARFLQADPTGYKDDVDLYTYTADDPVDKVDTDGTRARVMIDDTNRVVRVIVPITMLNDPSEGHAESAVRALSQSVPDNKGHSWQVNFEAVNGRLTDGNGVSYSNVYSHDGSGQHDSTGGKPGEWGETANTGDPHGTQVQFSANPLDKVIKHELGGHSSGLPDLYDTKHNIPNPNFNGNLMNNDDSHGSAINFGQLQQIMSPKSGNEVFHNQTQRTWGQWLQDNF
jgi:hypothetical protein